MCDDEPQQGAGTGRGVWITNDTSDTKRVWITNDASDTKRVWITNNTK